MREIVSDARVPRALILLDACRQRLTSDARSVDRDPRSAAALLRDLAAVNGQVVFSAAAPGEYAYDDHDRKNGVFTAVLIDGLRCAATTDSRGYVTVDTLKAYVEEQVLSWIQKNRDHDANRPRRFTARAGRARCRSRLADEGLHSKLSPCSRSHRAPPHGRIVSPSAIVTSP